ncbi:MAG: bifunctional methylenetetrahydrofolate dehydrogenase/methenyltetrahydrofolate cyclohydrolase FolD [Chloroflexi bacterium]|nr:bifunctional methylenetetrahydrofolate dehydrogenase/methenyltetrahydrofolate cyclohydrolase FolD [Chloroflexota bacterium]
MAKVLDGRATAQEIHAEVKAGVDELRRKHGVTPGLAAVLVGDDPASAIYVRNKGRACQEVGIYSQTFNLPADTPQEELQTLIQRLNDDAQFHGILVQLPLPEHLNEGLAIGAVSPQKDVDCIHPLNLGLLSQGNSDFVPATPGGIQQLLLRNGYNPEGKHVVICGRSNIVGKPLAILLMQKRSGANATVTVCHTGTPDLGAMTRQADILVAAMGRPRFITVDMVRDGAVVVDVGINRVEDASRRRGYRLVGDVDYDALLDKVEAITPVPGGVGPMTIAMLLVNTITAARLSIHGKG